MSQPLGISSVRLVSLTSLDIFSIGQAHYQTILQNIEHRLPVRTGAFHDDVRTASLHQPSLHRFQIRVEGAELAHFYSRFAFGRTYHQAYRQVALADIN